MNRISILLSRLHSHGFDRHWLAVQVWNAFDRTAGASEGAPRCRVASCGGYSSQKDQPPEVVDEVRHADFHFGSRDPNRSDELPHSILLLGEDMFDV